MPVYTCNICFKSYPHSGSLRNHLRAHKEPLHCPVCPAHYVRSTSLKDHLTKKHGLEPSEASEKIKEALLSSTDKAGTSTVEGTDSRPDLHDFTDLWDFHTIDDTPSVDKPDTRVTEEVDSQETSVESIDPDLVRVMEMIDSLNGPVSTTEDIVPSVPTQLDMVSLSSSSALMPPEVPPQGTVCILAGYYGHEVKIVDTPMMIGTTVTIADPETSPEPTDDSEVLAALQDIEKAMVDMVSPSTLGITGSVESSNTTNQPKDQEVGLIPRPIEEWDFMDFI